MIRHVFKSRWIALLWVALTAWTAMSLADTASHAAPHPKAEAAR
jgi:hypothetical protein